MDIPRDGPIAVKPDTSVSGAAPIFAFDGEEFARLRERVGIDLASWMFAWSPHHLDFHPVGMGFIRILHEVGPYIWVEATRKFAAVVGEGGHALVPVAGEVFVYQGRPWSTFAAVVASSETPPSLDELTSAFDHVGAGRVVKSQDDLEHADPVQSALERWRPPSLDGGEARFFVRERERGGPLYEVAVDLAHRTVDVETLE